MYPFISYYINSCGHHYNKNNHIGTIGDGMEKN